MLWTDTAIINGFVRDINVYRVLVFLGIYLNGGVYYLIYLVFEGVA